MTNVNLYTSTAPLYDFDNRELLNDDLELCLKYVNETQDDILEIACGTGRITIPILNATDRKLTAFDLSDEMLSVFKEKLPLPHRLVLIKADMSNFDFSQKFGLIILIWRAFQVLLSEKDAINCLESIKKHMDKETIFLFSVFLPQKEYGADWLGKEVISYETVDTSTNNKIKRSTKNLSSDESNQIIKYASIYNITTPQGEQYILQDEIIYKYYYPDQIKQLLTEQGFTILKEYMNSTDLYLTLKI